MTDLLNYHRPVPPYFLHDGNSDLGRLIQYNVNYFQGNHQHSLPSIHQISISIHPHHFSSSTTALIFLVFTLPSFMQNKPHPLMLVVHICHCLYYHMRIPFLSEHTHTHDYTKHTGYTTVSARR